MNSGPSTVTDAYLEHLTAQDLSLLLPSGYEDRELVRAATLFRSRHGLLEEALASNSVFDTVFILSDAGDPFLDASPFLVFAVCIHRAVAELRSASYVHEWLAPGRRAPVFDVERLREFVAEPWRRFFLVELLASYTHVASGSVMVFTRRGIRRQRFSELDPVRLAALLEVVPDSERPGIFRRLGDLALFLTGVFPDHVARRGFAPIEEGRLLRSGGLRPDATETQLERRVPGPPESGAVGLLDSLGRRWYRAAFELLPRPVPDKLVVMGDLPGQFGYARRILGLVTEKFLCNYRDRWFGSSAG